MAKTLDEAGVKRLIQEIKGANKDLNTPIPISPNNTTESMAQNVKNIADYIEKAKAAGIDTTKNFRIPFVCNDLTIEGVYTQESKNLMGINVTDEDYYPYCAIVDYAGRYSEKLLIAQGALNIITSDMLDKGARKPIILTPDTTEVDEETYQKLLSDNVDVVFKDSDNCFNIFFDKGLLEDVLQLTFVLLVGSDTNMPSDYVIVWSYISIDKASPHHLNIESYTYTFEDILSQFNKSTLTPILQEIDLTGTDADRKAKLDKFETDWKTLTGASDLTGARFVGKLINDDDSYTTVIFTYALVVGDDDEPNTYLYNAVYIPSYYEFNMEQKQAIFYVTIDPANGKLSFDNKLTHVAEVATINYNKKLRLTYNASSNGTDAYLSSIYDDEIGEDIIGVDFGNIRLAGVAAPINDSDVTTKTYVDNIQSLNAKSLEAITIKTGNTTTDKADNKTAIQAYIDNLTDLGVDTTKGYNIPIYVAGQGSGFIGKRGDSLTAYMGIMVSFGVPTFGIYVDAAGGYYAYKLQTETDNSLTTTSKKIVSAINEVNALARGVNAFGAIELKASDNDSNKAAITAYLKILTDAGVSTTNGYSVPVRITGNSQEYHGMLNIGTGVLLSGVVTDVNENHHYPFNVSTTDGAILFDENNYFLEKTSNEVTEMLDAIKYSYTSVPFTDTTLSNKAQLEVFLSKVPAATVMHCTYKEIWAGTLHKINGDWYGLLVKNTNSPADNINVKLSADGTIVTSNSAQ